MIATLASDAIIDTAYAWLCRQRAHWGDHADVWALRFDWAREKPRLQRELLEGRYRFEPLSRVTKLDGETVHIWSARDALVLKAQALVPSQVLPASWHRVNVKPSRRRQVS
jgi:RNA-directed DNA polymerase